MSVKTPPATSTTTAIVPDWDILPCVQYGFPKGKGAVREPKLRTIFEPIPKGVITASPVYGLTRDQYDRQHAEWRKSGYHVTGDYKMIATKLQDECEADDRVLYPIHIESDELYKYDPTTLINWFREFTEDYLDVPFQTCTLYFSGSRSIHVHVPRFASGERQREWIKERAETFCEETGAELDCCLYSSKRLFRLPGVEHEKTGVPKIEIDGEWDDSQMCKLFQTATPQVPESYEAVLRDVFVRDSLTIDSASSTTYTPHDLFRVLDSDKTVLEFERNKQTIETPLIEQQDPPNDDCTSDMKRWCMYNAKEFSPYALAEGGSRSVAVVKVKGTPFARKEVTIGNFNRPVHALIPAYFYGARGCAGKEFTKADEHAPLQLSKTDYGTWEKQGIQTGDRVVIIGGKNRRSIIHCVESWQATVVGHALTGEGGSRQAALEYLKSEGYDVGSAGKSKPKSLTAKLASSGRPSGTRPCNTEPTEAEKLKLQAEQNGIHSLTHHERVRVACRLLLKGWQPAWEWFQEQFGSGFKPDVTRTHFASIVNEYPEYDHVEVPPL